MRILTVDIETSPHLVYTWGTFKQNVSLDQIVDPKRMICWAARWHGQKQVLFGAEWEAGTDFVKALYDLLDEADVVVTYNGKTFDLPIINWHFLERGWGPPSPYAHVDLYQTVRSKFKAASGKLDYICQQLELGGKAATGGFKLWVDVLQGDASAQNRMKRYNKQDVVLTEELYDFVLPWISQHPNILAFDTPTAAHACPSCGCNRLQKRGFARTKVSVFQQFRCNDCGTYSRSGRSLRSVDLRQVR